MKNIIFKLLTVALSLWVSLSHAGVVVGGTRLIYNESQRETSLSVKNPDNSPYLIQSWADNNGPTGEEKDSAKPPFMVTPPLFRLDAGKENLLRIVRLGGGNIPEDRESIYWLNVKSIPSSSDSDKNVLQLSIKTRIKLFFRPSSIKTAPQDEYKNITFQREGSQLKVTNPTPFYVTFYSLKVGGTSVKTTNEMVPPKGSAVYPLPTGVSGNKVSWQAINDYGGNSSLIDAVLH